MSLKPTNSSLLLLLLLLLSLPVSATQSRLALVIGNADYRHATRLVNTLNDANDVATDLKAAGFKVTRVKNADLNTLIDAVDGFVARLHQAGGVGLLYYSGHGVRVDGHNYLVPVDAKLKRKSRVKYEAYSLNDALSRMGGRGADAVNLVILDACRDNPFSVAKGAGNKGLARVDAPESTLILYATKPGATASDNPDGRNGLFTKHLRKAIKRPGINIESSFSDVVKGVYSDSNREQYPWKEGVLLSEFRFLDGLSGTTPAQPKEEPPELGSLQLEFAYWASMDQCGTINCYKAYQNAYPTGHYASAAQAQIARLKGTVEQVSYQRVAPSASPTAENVEKNLALKRKERQQIQAALNTLGYPVGVADGVWGKRTRESIQAWQRANGKRSTGFLDGAAYKLLLTEAGAVKPLVVLARRAYERKW